jgi:hypothetical protein
VKECAEEEEEEEEEEEAADVKFTYRARGQRARCRSEHTCPPVTRLPSPPQLLAPKGEPTEILRKKKSHYH